jgi:hypothetical protein
VKVILEGITLKGKNKIRQHGSTWTVLEIRTRVECLGGKIGYYLESLADTLKLGKEKQKDRRWVAVQDDEDFKVTLQ